MYYICFKTESAIKYGVDEAIMLEQIIGLINLNLGNKEYFKEGKYWINKSIKEFQEIFPFWSIRQIERIINSLEKQCVITSKKFNKNKYDQTKWYTLNIKNLKEEVK